MLEVIKKLLEKGSKVNNRTKEGYTPLILTAKRDHDTKANNMILELLLDQKADVNLVDECQRSPLHEACRKGHTVMAQKLIDGGSDVDTSVDKNNMTPFHEACKSKKSSKDFINMLLQHTKDIESWLINPFHLACKNGNLNVLEALADKKASLKDTNEEGQTSLHIAASRGTKDVAEFLIKRNGLDINARDQRQRTALHIAVGNSPNFETVSFFLDKGADIEVRDDNGRYPLHLACMNCNEIEIVRLVLREGTEINVTDLNGRTPLHLAVQYGRDKTVKLLLDHNCKC